MHEKVSVQMLSHIDFLRPIAGAAPQRQHAVRPRRSRPPDRAVHRDDRRRLRRDDLDPLVPQGAPAGGRVPGAARQGGHPVPPRVRRSADRARSKRAARSTAPGTRCRPSSRMHPKRGVGSAGLGDLLPAEALSVHESAQGAPGASSRWARSRGRHRSRWSIAATPPTHLALPRRRLVLGELLVLRLEDGSAVPLSFAVHARARVVVRRRRVRRASCSGRARRVLRRPDRRTSRWAASGSSVDRLAVGAATLLVVSRRRRHCSATARRSSTSWLRSAPPRSRRCSPTRVVPCASPARSWRLTNRGLLAWLADRVVGHVDGDRVPTASTAESDVRHLGTAPVLHAAPRGLVRLRAARLRHAGVPPDDRGARDGTRARWAGAGRALRAGRDARGVDGRPARAARPRARRPRDGGAAASRRPGDARRSRSGRAPGAASRRRGDEQHVARDPPARRRGRHRRRRQRRRAAAGSPCRCSDSRASTTS